MISSGALFLLSQAFTSTYFYFPTGENASHPHHHRLYDMSFKEKGSNWVLCPNPPGAKQFLLPKFSSSVFFYTFCHHPSCVSVLFTMIKHCLPAFASQEIICVVRRLDPLLNYDCWQQLSPHLYTSYCICHLSYIWASEQAQSADTEAWEKSIHLSIWEVLINCLCLKYVYDCFLVFFNQLWSRSERQTMLQSVLQPPLGSCKQWRIAEKRQCGNGFGVIKCLRAAVAVQCRVFGIAKRWNCTSLNNLQGNESTVCCGCWASYKGKSAARVSNSASACPAMQGEHPLPPLSGILAKKEL